MGKFPTTSASWLFMNREICHIVLFTFRQMFSVRYLNQTLYMCYFPQILRSMPHIFLSVLQNICSASIYAAHPPTFKVLRLNVYVSMEGEMCWQWNCWGGWGCHSSTPSRSHIYNHLPVYTVPYSGLTMSMSYWVVFDAFHGKGEKLQKYLNV